MADDVIDLQALQKKMSPRGILIGAVVLLGIIALMSMFYKVGQQEEAVILRLGEYNRTTGPGLHMKWPFGIEKNINVETQRVLKEEFGFRTEEAGVVTRYSRKNYSQESVMLTGDLNIAEVTWVIQYQIKDPQKWLFNVEKPVNTIRDISQSVINMLVGDLAVFDIVTTERSRIESNGKVLMNKFFKEYGLGINVQTVKLQNTMYPKGRVRDAFEDVNKAIQDLERLMNEGKESYSRAIPKAEGNALRVIQEAEGYAIEKVNKAIGDVARFNAVLSEYKKSPRITRIRLYYEMMEEVFKKTENTDIIDRNLKNFVPFKALTDKKGGSK